MNRWLRKVSRCQVALMVATTTTSAQAEEAPQSFTDALPGTEIASSGPSVIEGLYEVVAGENVLYVDASGRYLVIGSIYDLHEDKDLSAERRAEVRRSRASGAESANLLDQLPGDAAVTTGAGDRRLTVIMDPDCGWCRRLWAESLSDLVDVEVRHLLPNPSARVIGILCAKDPAQALSQALGVAATTTKTRVPSARCRRQASEKIERVAEFVESNGLSGTPVLIREDGEVHPGYLGRASLLSWLDGSSDNVR